MSAEHQTILYTDQGLSFGEVLFQSIQKVIRHNGFFRITGQDTQGAVKTLEMPKPDKVITQMEAQRKLSPNVPIISKCLGLAHLSMGEVAIAENSNRAPIHFQESINSLERALEQDPEDAESTLNLILAYCYAEDMEDREADDYSELIDDLLAGAAPALLPVIAEACSIRGHIYFEEQRFSLGFNFMKQELFLWRYQQLLSPENTELRNSLEAKAADLTKQCKEQKWFGIAEQLTEQVEAWLAETPDSEDADSLDARLVEAAGFERAGKAYLSHKDKVSALNCFEDHTKLMKVIYQDHAPKACYANMLIESYECLIDLNYQLDLNEKGDGYQQEMIDLVEELLKAYPQDEFYLNALAACNEALAERRLAENKLTEARSLYLKSLEISKTLVSIDPQMEDYKNHQSNTLDRLKALEAQLENKHS